MRDEKTALPPGAQLTSLKWLILIGCATAVFTVLVVAVYLTSALQQGALENWKNQTLPLARSLARSLDREVGNAAGDLRLLASLPQFQNLSQAQAIDRSIGGVPQDMERHKRRILGEYLKQQGSFSVLFMLTSGGDHYLAEPYSVQRQIRKYNMRDRDYFQETQRQRATVLSDSYLGADGIPAVAINTPILGEDGSIRAHLGGVYHLQRLSHLIGQIEVDVFDELLLLDRMGELIARSDQRQQATDEWGGVELADRPGVSRVWSTLSGRRALDVRHHEISEQGRSDLAFSVPLESGWSLIALRDRQSVLDSVATRSYAIIATTALILISIAGFGLAFVNSAGKRWEAAQAALREAKEELELEVQERTRELFDSHQHVELLLASSGAGIFGIDTDGRCTFFNNACIEILGYEINQDLLGRHFHEIVNPRRADGTPYQPGESPISQAVSQDKRIHREHERFCSQAGHCISVEYRAYPMRKEGHVVGAVVTFNDISARIQAQQAQADSDARFRSLFAQSHDAIFLLDTETGRYLDANRAAQRLTGRSLEQLLRLSTSEVSPRGAEQRRRQARTAEETIDMGEVVYQRPDGSERTTQLSVVPLADGLVFGIAHDLTDKLASQRALRESEEYLRVLSDASFEAIFLLEDGTCLGQNLTAEKLFGYTRDEAIGRSILEWIAGTSKALVRKHMQAGFTEPYLAQAQRKDGSVFPAEIRGSSMQYQGRQVRITVLRDISERRRAEQGLRHTNALLRAVIDQAPFAITLGEGNETDWVVTLANREAQRITGVDLSRQQKLHFVAGELQEPGVRSWQMFNPDGSLIPIADTPLVKAMQRQETTRNREMVIRRDDGGETQVLGHASPIYGDNGELIASIFTYPDISEHKRTEETIRTLSQAVEQSPVSVVITTPEGIIEYANRGFERTSGYTAGEVKGQHTRVLGSGNTPQSTYQDLWQSISAGRAWKGEFQNRRKDGSLFWEYAHISPIFDSQGAIRNYLAVKEDVTWRKLQEQKILHQAHYDSLTGLPNRFLALDRLSQILRVAQREDQLAAVLFLDLDDFKKVNDTLGHEVGDQVIVEAAQRVRWSVREEDTVGRLGGDEFIVLLSDLQQREDAAKVAEKILAAFRTVFRLAGREVLLTTSIGISIYPDDGDSAKILLRNADTAMYHSKSLGRNAFHFYTEAMNKDVARRVELEEQMHTALQKGEFHLLYQPIVNIHSQQLVAAEALLRWNNPKLGQVSPVEFIEIAERTGRIVEVGEFVLREAVKQARKWYERKGHSFRMAVNVSPVQFKDRGFLQLVRRVLEEYDLPGSSLEIEVTENVLLSERINAVELMNSLRELGVSISMDDFGTGYSSLSYLRHYPFDTIKIDSSFVRDITSDKDDRELIVATLSMARSLGLKVIAEGVETAEQLAILQAEQCDFAQGYYFSKPIPQASVERLFLS
ncbi:MAG: PAS domain S-box protein [Sedimenticola sp.]|nr:PAS domain S-box protein [Sedimenticola sp.]